ncbi:MAG: hypothetical protein JWN44_3001 [Myxococcales bacterium]|nr:hypothetical protein [Myxococcales bacterium]
MRKWTVVMLLFSATALAAPSKKRHPPTRRPPVSAPAPSPAPSPSPSNDATPSESPADAAPNESAPPAAGATPAPAPPPPPAPAREEPPSSKANVDLDGLNREYNALRDELFRSRAKAHLLGDAMFKTKIVAQFQYKAQRAWPIKKVTLKIDDQPVFTADSPSTNDPLKLYDGFAAPGKHTLSLRVECGATGEERVAYGAEGVFVVDVAENKQTNVGFVVDESGDGPAKLAKKREGTFDVRVRADLETVERQK